MNQEHHVDFDTAKSLKELGFDEGVIYFFPDVQEFENQVESEEGFFNYNQFDSCISAPTLYEAQQYLFEKYGIWISSKISIRDMIVWVYFVDCADDTYSLEESDSDFEHPNKALSEGIKEAIQHVLKKKKG